MTDPAKLSRRDWFRLQLARPESESTQPVSLQTDSQTKQRDATMGQSKAGLRSIAHPENHDGLDLSQLPPMREALLSTAQIEQLFADIDAMASDILLMQRSSRAARATATQATSSDNLDSAKSALLSGHITRLQIRYRWDDTAWIDTLETKPEGTRLIRIAHHDRAS